MAPELLGAIDPKVVALLTTQETFSDAKRDAIRSRACRGH
jgi:hypothetical protein